MSPRAYEMKQRQAATDKTRERILSAARKLLLAKNFSEFTMDSVARAADVSRLTVYYQFQSKAGLLEALYNYIARRGRMDRLAEIFRQGDAIRMIHDFIVQFASFWASDRDVIRRLHGVGAIDPEVGEGLRKRNDRRRKGLSVIVERYQQWYPLPLQQIARVIDTLHMLTSFETFDDLAREGRTFEEVVAIIRSQAHHAMGFTPKFVPPQNP